MPRGDLPSSSGPRADLDPVNLLSGGSGDNLISFDEVITRADRRGVNFGKGNPSNRLRYFTKIGLLPHAKRKSFNGGSPSGAYPEWVIDRLVEIERELSKGKSVQSLLREEKEVPKPQVSSQLQQFIFTPIPQIKKEEPQPQVTSPPIEKGPPLELFAEERYDFPIKITPTYYLAALALVLVSLPVLYLLNPSLKNNTNDIISYLKGLNPQIAQQDIANLDVPEPFSQVLGSVTDPFLTINVETDVNALLNAKGGIKTKGADVDAETGRVFASNILYGVQEGTSVDVSGDPQNPTISVTGIVASVSGTSGRITSTGGSDPVIDIASTYAGQTSINTIGTVTTGVWQATAVGPTFGGTGQTSVTRGDVIY